MAIMATVTGAPEHLAAPGVSRRDATSMTDKRPTPFLMPDGRVHHDKSNDGQGVVCLIFSSALLSLS